MPCIRFAAMLLLPPDARSLRPALRRKRSILCIGRRRGKLVRRGSLRFEFHLLPEAPPFHQGGPGI
jgi:hypothetical protein